MYVPPAFREEHLTSIHRWMLEIRLAHLVTTTAEGIIATPLPMFVKESEGDKGTLYGHVARANPQWKMAPTCEAMAIFAGPDAYVTPSWYPTKKETGKVVPTWNYIAIHAYGPIEFFEDADRLLDVVTRLTDLHEQTRADRWLVTDAPADFIKTQLRGIVGLRIPITRLDAKRKMSQNRNAADRAGVIKGLSESDRLSDRIAAALIPQE